MSDHSSSVFNNSCLKLPRNPRSKKPLAGYEQRFLNDLQIEIAKFNEEAPENMKIKEKDRIKDFIEFFDSIPEYDDVNHLSNKEFYRKIEMLKEKRKNFCGYVESECKFDDNKTLEWIEDYKSGVKKKEEFGVKKSLCKPFCVTPILSKSPKYGKGDDVESLSPSDKELFLKPSSRRSVRIETPIEKLLLVDSPEENCSRPKSRVDVSDIVEKDIDWGCDSYKFDLGTISPSRLSRSAPNSPIRSKDTTGITIPKPFEMTVRDEENKIVEELLTKTKPKEQKLDLFKAHPIPIESQIPLFDKIMEDQERKSRVIRQRSKALLQAQMRPFSFTKRDEEIQKLTREFSKSSPNVFLDDPPLKIKKFKAKPVPKNLFSNYIYKKMYEDEFYRALQKKIRAEEMLKAASLPPSMAKREKYIPKYDVCPRSYRDVVENNEPKKLKNKYKFSAENYEKELEDLKNEFLANPKLKKRTKRKNKKYASRNFSASSTDSRTISSLDMPSVNRSNLAAVLRIQSARKRLEIDMCRRLEEAKLKEEVRWREKLLRKKPVWQALAYSHEEDLAIRLQLRREEERLRNEEHRLRMQQMLGRVTQQPTLFERQSQMKFPKTRQELIDQLYNEYKSRENSKSRLDDFLDLKAETRDVSVQALLDRGMRQQIDSDNSKEPTDEEKDKCNSTSSEDNNC